nr:hypothetical protein [Propionibacterium sp.]
MTQARPSSDPQPLNVLFVCTANICRSAYATVRARQLLGADAPVTVGSAGTHGWVDHPMDAPMAAEARARGADPDAFRSRRLTGAPHRGRRPAAHRGVPAPRLRPRRVAGGRPPHVHPDAVRRVRGRRPSPGRPRAARRGPPDPQAGAGVRRRAGPLRPRPGGRRHHRGATGRPPGRDPPPTGGALTACDRWTPPSRVLLRMRDAGFGYGPEPQICQRPRGAPGRQDADAIEARVTAQNCGRPRRCAPVRPKPDRPCSIMRTVQGAVASTQQDPGS